MKTVRLAFSMPMALGDNETRMDIEGSEDVIKSLIED
jgi:hypothetical protein